MTRDERIARAVALLGKPSSRQQVADAVQQVDGRRIVAPLGPFYRPKDTDQKTAARQLERAAKRLEGLLKKELVAPKIISVAFPKSKDELEAFDIWMTNLRRLREAAAGFANWKLGAPKRSDAKDKDVAAKVAAELLIACGLPVRGRKYHDLAAILYGDDVADLSKQCRPYLGRNRS
jgi:hypothetical protein